MKDIRTVQEEIEKALAALPSLVSQLPSELKPLEFLAPGSGLGVQVSLRHGDIKKSRQVKSTAPADSWSPESDVIFISYEERTVNASVPVNPPAPAVRPIQIAPAKEASGQQEQIAGPAKLSENERSPGEVARPIRELLFALDKAEKTIQFVSLKWFRDTFLVQQNLAWAETLDERDRFLREAIDRRWILMSKVPNPKNPQFPVTAIRVNRPLPEVREILEGGAQPKSPFSPIAITGELMSQTVLRERR